MNNNRLIPLINGVEHSWADIAVVAAGVLLVGITEINYADEQVVENAYGIGSNPVGRGYGNITPSADITISRKEVEALRAASPTGRLQDIEPFDIIVAYIPIKGNTKFTHTIKQCSFANDSASWKQGDTHNNVNLKLVPSAIVWDLNKITQTYVGNPMF